jgi:hypothetical protein
MMNSNCLTCSFSALSLARRAASSSKRSAMPACVTKSCAAYNFARRLKTLKGLTPYGYICRSWSKEPQRFTLDPLHQMP